MMRTTWISAASVLALLAAPALGQTTAPSSPAPTVAPMQGQPDPLKQEPDPLKQEPDPLKQEDVSQIKGAVVYGGDNKKIGSIATVLMRPDSHQIDRLVVGAGGVLGVGAHDVALPINQFRWDSQRAGFKISKTAADLKAMPAWVASGAAKGMNGSSAAPAPATTR
jgi:PRC-barrel domain